MRIFILLSALLCSTQFLSAQGKVTGKVVDAGSGDVLIGATIVLVNSGNGGIADLSGNFTIEGISNGNHSLEISYVGFTTKKVDFTISNDGTTDVGTIQLESSAVGLKEIQVFADVIVQDRKTPIAVSTIGAKDIEERFAGTSIAQIIDNNPGVYTIQGAGGYGDQEVYIRGFDQSNVAFLVNGIPVNDMENGRMFWSNFAGLSEVSRNLQVQRGLGASKLAISSIGGTVNMVSKPSNHAKGYRFEHQIGTGSWNNRTSFTYHTGLNDKGWAASFQGARTTTNGSLIGLPSSQQGSVVPGAFTDAWSYYVAISKTLNSQHQIQFWAFGAPFNRGSAFIVDDATRNQFGLPNQLGNNALGIYHGELFNARQNKVHKPLMAATHYWDLDPNTSITSSVYFSLARVHSTQPRDANNTTFFPERDRGSLTGRGVDPDRVLLGTNLINWDYMEEVNRSDTRYAEVAFPGGDTSIPMIAGQASRFYLESRHNDHEWIGAISTIKKQMDDLSLMGGVDLRLYRGAHYAEAFDLLGGDFVINRGSFLGTPIAGTGISGTGDFAPGSNVGDEQNKLAPNTVAKQGDRINYDYDGIVNWASVFGQVEYTLGNMDVFGSATLSTSSQKRVGNFWSGRDIYNLYSLGESPKSTYYTYTIKSGLNYRIDNRINVYINGGYFTRPPFLSNSFADSRFSGQYRTGLTTEKIASFEAGAGYRMNFLKVNANAYYLQWRDRTTRDEFTPDEGLGIDADFTPFTFSGLTSEHKGVELDFVANPTSVLEVNGFIGLGDWKWANNVSQEFVDNDGNLIDEITVEMAGLPVGTSAQQTAGLGLHYRGIRSAYIGGRWNWADRIPIRYNPEDLINRFITREIILEDFPSYSTFSLYAGKYIDISDDISGRISISIQNLFNANYTRFASYFFNQVQQGIGYPRTFTLGLRVDF